MGKPLRRARAEPSARSGFVMRARERTGLVRVGRCGAGHRPRMDGKRKTRFYRRLQRGEGRSILPAKRRVSESRRKRVDLLG